jgi:hypothetical protein
MWKVMTSKDRGFKVESRESQVESSDCHWASLAEGLSGTDNPVCALQIFVTLGCALDQGQSSGLATSRTVFVADVLPNHTKMVKALLRALDGRKQDTLSRLCRKLREGDMVKFVREITHEDGE